MRLKELINLFHRDKLEVGGIFEIECVRNGKVIWREKTHNKVTNEGLDAILNIMLHATTQITTWYCALVESNTVAASGMTYAVPVYTETIAYDEATRPEYVEAAASSQSITNSASKATFTINSPKTMYGAALVGGGAGASTKADTASSGGKLFCFALFGTARAVLSGDVINLTYTISAASST